MRQGYRANRNITLWISVEVFEVPSSPHAKHTLVSTGDQKLTVAAGQHCLNLFLVLICSSKDFQQKSEEW